MPHKSAASIIKKISEADRVAMAHTSYHDPDPVHGSISAIIETILLYQEYAAASSNAKSSFENSMAASVKMRESSKEHAKSQGNEAHWQRARLLFREWPTSIQDPAEYELIFHSFYLLYKALFDYGLTIKNVPIFSTARLGQTIGLVIKEKDGQSRVIINPISFDIAHFIFTSLAPYLAPDSPICIVGLLLNEALKLIESDYTGLRRLYSYAFHLLQGEFNPRKPFEHSTRGSNELESIMLHCFTMFVMCHELAHLWGRHHESPDLALVNIDYKSSLLNRLRNNNVDQKIWVSQSQEIEADLLSTRLVESVFTQYHASLAVVAWLSFEGVMEFCASRKRNHGNVMTKEWNYESAMNVQAISMAKGRLHPPPCIRAELLIKSLEKRRDNFTQGGDSYRREKVKSALDGCSAVQLLMRHVALFIDQEQLNAIKLSKTWINRPLNAIYPSKDDGKWLKN